MARVILDTGVLVVAVRGRLDPSAYTDGDDVALPAVVLAEYLTGIELDDDSARRAQQAFLDELLAVLPVVDYTRDVAIHHAALLAHVRRAGRLLPRRHLSVRPDAHLGHDHGHHAPRRRASQGCSKLV